MICDVCFTNSWQPCPPETLGAIQDDTVLGGYMVCGYCTQAEANRQHGLTLVTLCDMVLDDGMADRSDDALIRAVGELLRSKVPRTINFGFTFECPNCGKLVERSHLQYEVLFSGVDLGSCPECGANLGLNLTSASLGQFPDLEKT